MATEPEPEPALPFSIVSVVEDVLQKHGGRLSDINFASRKAQEACKYHISLFFFTFLRYCHFLFFRRNMLICIVKK